jgi:hypothetical protein
MMIKENRQPVAAGWQEAAQKGPQRYTQRGEHNANATYRKL